jgi:hypothetical protein
LFANDMVTSSWQTMRMMFVELFKYGAIFKMLGAVTSAATAKRWQAKSEGFMSYIQSSGVGKTMVAVGAILVGLLLYTNPFALTVKGLIAMFTAAGGTSAVGAVVMGKDKRDILKLKWAAMKRSALNALASGTIAYTAFAADKSMEYFATLEKKSLVFPSEYDCDGWGGRRTKQKTKHKTRKKRNQNNNNNNTTANTQINSNQKRWTKTNQQQHPRSHRRRISRPAYSGGSNWTRTSLSKTKPCVNSVRNDRRLIRRSPLTWNAMTCSKPRSTHKTTEPSSMPQRHLIRRTHRNF